MISFCILCIIRDFTSFRFIFVLYKISQSAFRNLQVNVNYCNYFALHFKRCCFKRKATKTRRRAVLLRIRRSKVFINYLQWISFFFVNICVWIIWCRKLRCFKYLRTNYKNSQNVLIEIFQIESFWNFEGRLPRCLFLINCRLKYLYTNKIIEGCSYSWTIDALRNDKQNRSRIIFQVQGHNLQKYGIR